MGISIYVLDEGSPLPRGVIVGLTCDVAGCGGAERLQACYIDAHGAAMSLGWLERQTPQGRLWLCPACSGKPVSF